MKLCGRDEQEITTKRPPRVQNEVAKCAAVLCLLILCRCREFILSRPRSLHLFKIQFEYPRRTRTAAAGSSRHDHYQERFADAAEDRGAADFVFARLALHHGRRQSAAVYLATLHL